MARIPTIYDGATGMSDAELADLLSDMESWPTPKRELLREVARRLRERDTDERQDPFRGPDVKDPA